MNVSGSIIAKSVQTLFEISYACALSTDSTHNQLSKIRLDNTIHGRTGQMEMGLALGNVYGQISLMGVWPQTGNYVVWLKIRGKK